MKKMPLSLEREEPGPPVENRRERSHLIGESSMDGTAKNIFHMMRFIHA
jgi:hypothetical protein